MGEVVIKTKDDKGAEIEQKLDDAAVQEIFEEHGGLKGELATAQGGAAKLKVVQDFMTKYNLDPEGFVENADGAFTLVNKLIEDGVIDTSGKLLVGKGTGKGPGDKGGPGPGDFSLDELLKGKAGKDSGDTKGLIGEEKLAALVAKAIGPTMTAMNKSLEEVTLVQTNMLRGQWEAKIQGQFPNLTTDDVRKVFSEAAVRPKEGLLEIAKELSERKSTERGTLEKELAVKWGVNLEEFAAANAMKEKGPEGGAAVMFQGKKFTLSKRRAAGNKDFVDPGKASLEYLKKQGILR